MLRISNLTEIGSSFPRVYSPVEKTAVEADKLQVGALVREEKHVHRSGAGRRILESLGDTAVYLKSCCALSNLASCRDHRQDC